MAILAILCYLQKDGKTLMIQSQKKGHFKEGYWNGLGGKLKSGETPEECVIREMKEESGLTVSHPRIAGILLFPAQNGDDWYVFVYTAWRYTGRVRSSSEGLVKWILNSNLPALQMAEGDYIFLPWIKKDMFFSAKFLYVKGKLTAHSVTFPILNS